MPRRRLDGSKYASATVADRSRHWPRTLMTAYAHRSSLMANGEAPGRSANVVPPWSKYPWRDHPLWVLAGGTVLALPASSH